jgi:hypothetical protein
MGAQVPNISVYVNEDLKGRMEREEGENWSRVAAAAFEKRLADLAKRRTVDDIQGAIQRLRASRIEYDESIGAEGFEAGRRWAEQSASFAQLKRLADIADRSGNVPISYGWDDFFDEYSSDYPSGSMRLACEIEGQELNRDIANDFWSSAIGSENPPSEDFARAFAKGAHYFFVEVVNLL